jgi:hypothetical protein
LPTRYLVEQLHGHRGSTIKTPTYLVKWVGLEVSDADWVPLANLRGSFRDERRGYHAAHALKVYPWMGGGGA